MSSVRVTLLGGFGASVAGEPVEAGAWRLKKARELVKLLALAPGMRLHREQLMDELWPDRGPAAAANNLHQAVHVARRALGRDAIEVRDELIRLAADVDVAEFGRAVAAARGSRDPAAYDAALSLYRGELLPENRYDDWAAEHRDELAQLHAELGRELAALGAHGLPGLPAEVSSFVGRARELAELQVLLRRTRLLTLTGAGGTGKTRLALELARRAEGLYRDGAALVELGTVADPRRVADAVGAALDVRSLPGRTLADALAGFLRERTVLLVLDNCEHVLAASAGLAVGLLRRVPQLTVLTTSREPLRVPGEVVFRVPALAAPDPEQLPPAGEMARYEAVRLFAERAAAAAPGFALGAGNAADVARVCARLDGLPLAIELAAARVGALSPAAIAARLDDRFRLLRGSDRHAPTRQQTLTATMQWSHDLLDPLERTLLRRIAVFAGGLELAAAEAVCAGHGLDGHAIADVLARLVDKSLVVADEQDSQRRYRLLETVRWYARERLRAADEEAAFTERHARWALALAERQRDEPGLDREAANLQAALDTLIARDPPAALRLCVALTPFWLRRIELLEAGRRFAAALGAVPERGALRARALLAAASIDFRAGMLATGRERAEESVAIADGVGDTGIAWRAPHFLATAAIVSDQGDEALRWLGQALAVVRREGLAAAEALCACSLGVTRWVLGDLTGADELLSRSARLFSALAHSAERIPAPVNIAEMRSSAGVGGSGVGGSGVRFVFEETLQPFTEVSCAAAVGYVLANQAGIARVLGDAGRARKLFDESAGHFESIGDERGTADVLTRRAYLDLSEGMVAAARDGLERALLLRRAMHDRRGTGLILTGLGRVETATGDHASARRRLGQARELFRRAGDRWGLAAALWRTADLALARGELADAEAALKEARAILDETGRDRWIAHTVAGLAEVAVARGDLDRSRALFQQARGLYAGKGDVAAVAELDERMARLGR